MFLFPVFFFQLEKELINYKANRRKEIPKIRAETNEIENRKVEKMDKTKSWLLEKINMFDEPLVRLVKIKTERTQFINIRIGRGSHYRS